MFPGPPVRGERFAQTAVFLNKADHFTPLPAVVDDTNFIASSIDSGTMIEEVQ
jgi:hypothetical protein